MPLFHVTFGGQVRYHGKQTTHQHQLVALLVLVLCFPSFSEHLSPVNPRECCRALCSGGTVTSSITEHSRACREQAECVCLQPPHLGDGALVCSQWEQPRVPPCCFCFFLGNAAHEWYHLLEPSLLLYLSMGFNMRLKSNLTVSLRWDGDFRDGGQPSVACPQVQCVCRKDTPENQSPARCLLQILMKIERGVFISSS